MCQCGSNQREGVNRIFQRLRGLIFNLFPHGASPEDRLTDFCRSRHHAEVLQPLLRVNIVKQQRRGSCFALSLTCPQPYQRLREHAEKNPILFSFLFPKLSFGHQWQVHVELPFGICFLLHFWEHLGGMNQRHLRLISCE